MKLTTVHKIKQHDDLSAADLHVAHLSGVPLSAGQEIPTAAQRLRVDELGGAVVCLCIWLRPRHLSSPSKQFRISTEPHPPTSSPPPHHIPSSLTRDMRATLRVRQSLQRHVLTAPSPLIRARGPTAAATALPASLETDFAIIPDFFNEAEARHLLEVALWKLDRSDPTRRRRSRRGPAAAVVAGTADPAGDVPLQDLFSGNYGFEEVGCDGCLQI